MSAIIGLHKPYTDPESGAPITFWRLSQYTVNVDGGLVDQISVKGFVSQAADQAGKKALVYRSFRVAALPEGGVSHQWLYEQLLGIDGDLKDAVPVHEGAAAAEPVAPAGDGNG